MGLYSLKKLRMHYTRDVLENGLRVVTVPLKDNPTVTVLVMVEAGSKYETKEINGLSHFLEHMCFKGTTKRPKAIDISRELDSIGAEYNAFTSQEFTGYFAKAEAKHFSKILDVVSDLYLNPTLDAVELEKEKGVIVEEINMYEDMPQRHVADLFMSLVYGDQPAGWNIAGTRENVKKFTRKDFVSYREAQYVAPATTVIVSGSFDATSVTRGLREAFGGLSSLPKSEKERTRDTQARPAALLEYKKTDQAHLVLGFRTFDTFAKEHPTMKIIEGILSGGMSSRLFQKLREEMGVGYYVRACEDSYTDHGLLTVSAGVDKERVIEVLQAILGELKRLRDEPVSAAELTKVKDYLVGTLYLGLESSDSVAEFLGFQEVLGKPLKTPEELIAELMAVTPSMIQETAGKIIRNDTLNLALIGPFENPTEFEKVLHF